VEGSDEFKNTWNQLVAASPKLAAFVAEASKDDQPDFVLRTTDESTMNKYGEAGGITLTLDAAGRDVDPSKSKVVRIDAQVSLADLANPTARAIMAQGGNVVTLANVMVHEFSHGILAVQGYQSNGAQAKKVECAIMAQIPGGRCR
jgi:hypothetical protein